MHVSFQTIDADHKVYGDPDAINMHISTAALVMVALGFPKPAGLVDVVGVHVDPTDIAARAIVFRWAVEAGRITSRPGVDVDKLLRRVDQVADLAAQALVAGHRLTWA